MDAQLKKGLLEMCVLKTLEKKDSYGYEIISTLDNVIKMSEATLYPILKRLEKQALVENYNMEYNSRIRKYYKITDIGKEKLKNFQMDYQELEIIYHYLLEEENE